MDALERPRWRATVWAGAIVPVRIVLEEYAERTPLKCQLDLGGSARFA